MSDEISSLGGLGPPPQEARPAGPPPQINTEDLKIITLARSSRARVAASEGAAVRDETGRTYTAAAVALPSLRLSALVSDAELDPGDLAVVRDLGPDATVFHAAPDGTIRAVLEA